MRRLTTPGWLLVHAAALVLVGTFLWLGWWQIGRAAGGNALSFGYSIEWPFFAAFVAFMWWREVRDVLRAGQRKGEAPAEAEADVPAAPGVTAFDPAAALADRARERAATAADAEPSAYDDYLAWLADHPRARPLDYWSAAAAAPARERPHGRAGEENGHG